MLYIWIDSGKERIKMISLIMGLPGSGKSLLLSYIAFRAVNGKPINFHGFHISALRDYGLKKYDYVFTNFPCEGAYSHKENL